MGETVIFFGWNRDRNRVRGGGAGLSLLLCQLHLRAPSENCNGISRASFFSKGRAMKPFLVTFARFLMTLYSPSRSVRPVHAGFW